MDKRRHKEEEITMVSKICIIVSLIVVATFAFSPAASATCSEASLSGTYGFLTGGTSGAGTPVASLIQITFDPTTATFISVETSSHDGVITVTPINGTYTVASNCIGEITVSQSQQVSFVVTSTGFFALNESAGRTIEGYGVKQGAATCAYATVEGNLGFEATGVFVAGAPVAGPVAFVGEVKFGVNTSGGGVISGRVTDSEDGVISTFEEEPITGSYTVAADCTGTATITPQGQPALYFSFLVVDGGKEMLALETDANTVVNGTLQSGSKQANVSGMNVPLIGDTRDMRVAHTLPLHEVSRLTFGAHPEPDAPRSFLPDCEAAGSRENCRQPGS
jgi:hypothetical protein